MQKPWFLDGSLFAEGPGAEGPGSESPGSGGDRILARWRQELMVIELLTGMRGN